MPDANITIADAAGTNVPVDTRTVTGGDHRQVVALGDGTDTNVAIVTTSGAVRVDQVQAFTAVRTVVTAAAADTQLLASNAARRGFTVWNDSTAVLYLALGSTAVSATDATVSIPAGGYYEAPYAYRGMARGIWAAANGAARITELT